MKHGLLLRLTVISVVLGGLSLCALQLSAQEEVEVLEASEVTRDYCEVTRLCGIAAPSRAEDLLPETLFDNYERQLTSIKGIKANVEVLQTIYECDTGKNCLAKRSVKVARWYVDFASWRYRVTRFDHRDRKSFDRDGACDATRCVQVVKRQGIGDQGYSASITSSTDVHTRTAILANNETFDWLVLLQAHRCGLLLPDPTGEGVLAIWRRNAPDVRKTAKFSLVGTDNVPLFGKCYVIKVDWKRTDWKGDTVRNYQAWLWFTPASQPIRSVEVIDYSDGRKSVFVVAVQKLSSLHGISIPISAKKEAYQSVNNAGTGASSFPLRPMLAEEVTLSQLELNPRWKRDDFAVSLPPNTFVHDARTNRTYTTAAMKGIPGGFASLILIIVVTMLVLAYIWRRLYSRAGS
ncbi:MAG: hypothetical protein ACUVRT_15505 [Armatimonadota bacterium]